MPVAAWPEIHLIAAVSRTGVIGRENQLPWRLPSDMDRFKRLTVHHTVVMGSNTWFSIPERFRPLPNRLNVVLTHNDQKRLEIGGSKTGVVGASSLSDVCLIHDHSAYSDKPLIVIGGTQIYYQFLRLATKLLITWVDAIEDGADAHFPFVCPLEWQQESDPIAQLADAKHSHDSYFVTYKRRSLRQSVAIQV